MSASVTSDIATHVREINNLNLLPAWINNKDVFESLNCKLGEKGSMFIEECRATKNPKGEGIVASM